MNDKDEILKQMVAHIMLDYRIVVMDITLVWIFKKWKEMHKNMVHPLQGM